jgi:hypothetical protein
MITIQGLSSRQKALCELMWSMETQHELTEFMALLNRRDNRDAQSLMAIMLQDSAEDEGLLAQYQDQAELVIDQARFG